MRKIAIPFSFLPRFFTKMILSFLAFFLCFCCLGNAIANASGETQSQPQIPDTPQRIVVFPLFAEEMLLEMIGPDRIVYVGHEYFENGEAHSPTMAMTEYIHGHIWQNSDGEEILEFEPDLVILAKDLLRDYDEIFPELVQANIAFLFLGSPGTIEDIMNTLVMLGEVVGAPEKAAQMVRDMEASLAQITEIVANIPDEQRVRAIYCDDWLSYEEDDYFPYNFPLAARAAGVINASGIDTYYGTISIDRLVEWNPDLLTIVPVWYDVGGYICDISDDFVEQFTASFLDNPALSTVTAIKNRNVHPLRLSASQFFVQSVKDLARLAYPDLFTEKED